MHAPIHPPLARSPAYTHSPHRQHRHLQIKLIIICKHLKCRWRIWLISFEFFFSFFSSAERRFWKWSLLCVVFIVDGTCHSFAWQLTAQTARSTKHGGNAVCVCVVVVKQSSGSDTCVYWYISIRHIIIQSYYYVLSCIYHLPLSVNRVSLWDLSLEMNRFDLVVRHRARRSNKLIIYLVWLVYGFRCCACACVCLFAPHSSSVLFISASAAEQILDWWLMALFRSHHFLCWCTID